MIEEMKYSQEYTEFSGETDKLKKNDNQNGCANRWSQIRYDLE